MADNSWKKEAKLPLVPGHEGVGKVAAVGPRVTTVRVGTQAILLDD
jgi:propanol-preferring alcohol dehydrogenase